MIDSLADYTDGQGQVSTVSSCDVYDFEHPRLQQRKVSKITSSTIAIQP